MRRIKYICYYPSQDPYKPRECVEAAVTKIDYIISVLNRSGIGVDIISPAIITKKGFCLSSGGNKQNGENSLRLFPSFGCHGFAPLRGLSRKLTYLCFHRWLKKNIKEGEPIIVYHSLDYCSFFLDLRIKKNFKLIGEVEEIYQDVHPQSKHLSEDEYGFYSVCDSFIFPNTVLDEKVNSQNKSSIVIHGLYKVQPKVANKFDDGLTHVLYAGTFDPVKGGALAAVEAAMYLSESYHLHITGFGSESDSKNVREKVTDITKKAKAQITFHGFISREELTVLMQRCHIGLCTQDPTKKLNLTSFPSKILNYLSNGLIVLSGRNRAIEESAVGDIVHYYEQQTPQEIANAIQAIDIQTGNTGQDRLLQLDKTFSERINSLLQW